MTDRVAPNAGKVLALLFAANLLNFFDRTMPSVLIEEVREDFPLSDAQIGLVAGAFTLVLALAGIPLGRLADRRSRRTVLGTGLGFWSVVTAASGTVTSFAGLLVTRIGVGIGEAAYAPAANSVIADLYPSAQRSRAVGTFMLGLPLGLMLAYFTVGPLVELFDSWRVPFFLAAVPGLVLAVAFFRMAEPARGAADDAEPVVVDTDLFSPRDVLRVPTLRRVTGAFVGYNIAAYSINAFCVPLLQRRFDLSLSEAGATTGAVLGVTGLIGLIAGGRIAERAAVRSPSHRLVVGAVFLVVAAPLTLVALLASSAATFAVLFACGWLLSYLFFCCCYPAISDVVAAHRRATAVAVVLAASYLLGGAAGPLIVGVISDGFADDAMREAGATVLTDAFRGEGLQAALRIVVPSSLLLAAVSMFLASRTVVADRDAA